MPSPYSVLGIPHGADPQEARRAFRAIAKAFHPDINPDPDAKHFFIEARNALREITGAVASADIEHRQKRVKTMPEIELPVSIWTAAQGGAIKGECPLGKATIKVPAGARNGDRLITTIAGRNVACIVRIIETEGFRAEGGDISSMLRVSLSQAVKGGFADIDTPNGKLRVKLPPNTPDGARLKIEGKGLNGNENRPSGDMYLDVSIVETVTDKAVFTLDKILAAARRPRLNTKFGKKRA